MDNIFKNYIRGEFVEHDNTVCSALQEYYNTVDYAKSPIKHKRYIADKYSVTLDDMKEHEKACQYFRRVGVK